MNHPNNQEKRIKPFKNLDAFVAWKLKNCDTCIFSHTPRPRQRYGAIEMVKKVDQGEECYLKYALHRSHLAGGIDQETAQEIGFRGGATPLYCRAYMPKVKYEPKLTIWESLKMWINKWRTRL